MWNPFRKRIACDEGIIEAIAEHVERYVGDIDQVYHEIVSDVVHIDVYIVAPSPERDYYTLVTSGMSSLPMKTPTGRKECAYSELVMCLPPSWHVLKADYKKEKYWWPFRLIKSLARLPHEYDLWMWTGSTVPNGDPAAPYDPSVRYCCALIAAPILFGDDFASLKVGKKKTLHFHTVLPLYKEEMEIKLSAGLDALFDRFDEKAPEISELMDPKRTNAGR